MLLPFSPRAMWTPKRLKHYPHFDRMLSKTQASELACDPVRVSHHAFFPFILFEAKWRKFAARKGKKKHVGPRKVKTRPIRYAARSDAYIFEYYRFMLQERYERRLEQINIAHVPIAYRKVSSLDGKGKSNIDFAEEAISEIKRRGNCFAIALDVSSFFDNLDHTLIYERWKALIGVERLPDDHFAVYKAICQHRHVKRDDLYRRLGIIGEKPDGTIGFLKNEKELGYQICPPATFRAMVCGDGSEFSSLISDVAKMGVPQGAPLSDLIANFYMIDFDYHLESYCRRNKVYFRRYSDDLLLICSDDEVAMNNLQKTAVDLLAKYGRTIQFKDEKARIHRFVSDGKTQKCVAVKGTGNFEYLGFQYNGTTVRLRDSTMSNLYRKIFRSCYVQARLLDERIGQIPLEKILRHRLVDEFIQQFGRIEDFEASELEPTDWTFYTYARRSISVFGGHNNDIAKQVSGYKKFIRRRLARLLRERGIT